MNEHNSKLKNIKKLLKNFFRPKMNKYNDKLQEELKTFNENINVHELPDIFHYWSNKYLKPIFNEYKINHPDDLFINAMYKSALECKESRSNFISIGSGNCDTEVDIAVKLKEKGLDNFTIECLDLNPHMLKRGSDYAIQKNVFNHLKFIEIDFNKWKADKKYTSIIANQSLHHIQDLEHVFREVKKSLMDNGRFITSDMIGRNGHQRWPEALDVVHNFWNELSDKYKYNHSLKRHEDIYINWDCSKEGFEGIRSQDILPLLLKYFDFELFVGFGNIIDIFVDRSFGHNFDRKNKWDTDFIDRVHECDEKLIKDGTIKPTHMIAVMKKRDIKGSLNSPLFSRDLSPTYCVRDPYKK